MVTYGTFCKSMKIILFLSMYEQIVPVDLLNFLDKELVLIKKD